MPPGDDIGTGEGTWLSLSLDGEPSETGLARTEQIGRLERALTSTPTPPQPPPAGDSTAGDHLAPTLQSQADAAVSALSNAKIPELGSDSRTSISIDSVSSASISVDGNSSISISSDSLPVAEERVEASPVEEETEAVEVPLPAPLEITLADEVLPWPPLLVAPTLVLPGAWPPPPGTLARSGPSLVGPSAAPVEEVSMQAQTSAMSVGSVSVELIIEDDPSVADAPSSTAQYVASSEMPPVRGTLDDMPVVTRRPQLAEASEYDDIPTEVSERDALEEALALLRSAAPGTPLGTSVDEDEDGDEAATTAEDLVSLELILDDHGPVDPEVLADLEQGPQGPVTLSLGAPSLRSAINDSPVWIDLVLEAPMAPAAPPLVAATPRKPTTTSERTTDLRALAEQRESSIASVPTAENDDSNADDDWLSDLPDEPNS